MSILRVWKSAQLLNYDIFQNKQQTGLTNAPLTHTHTRIYACVYIHTYMHTHTHTYICIYINQQLIVR